jgi:hypothetical protein
MGTKTNDLLQAYLTKSLRTTHRLVKFAGCNLHGGWALAIAIAVGILAILGFLALLVGLPKGLKGAPVHFATWQAVSRNRHLLLLLLITGLLAAGQLVVIAFVGPLLTELTGATARGRVFAFRCDDARGRVPARSGHSRA